MDDEVERILKKWNSGKNVGREQQKQIEEVFDSRTYTRPKRKTKNGFETDVSFNPQLFSCFPSFFKPI